jgi:hypothetical protein
MATIILGGAPGSNWLPLLLPLVALAAVMYTVGFIAKLVKQKKQRRPNERF